MKINCQYDLGTLEAVNVTGSTRIIFPPRRDMTWQTGFSGQAQGNPFSLGDSGISGQLIHITPGFRPMSSQEIKRAHKWAYGLGQHSANWMPITFAGRAAIAKATARTTKEMKVADLMVFVAKLREAKSGQVIPFPAWLSATGRQRLLEIANRGKK